MKKLIITIAIVLGMGISGFAQQDNFFGGGGLFERGANGEDLFGPGINWELNSGLMTPALPSHGLNTDFESPVGSGLAVLITLGGAYLVARKRKEEK